MNNYYNHEQNKIGKTQTLENNKIDNLEKKEFNKNIKTELNTPLDKNMEPKNFFMSPLGDKKSGFKELYIENNTEENNNNLFKDEKIENDFNSFGKKMRETFDISKTSIPDSKFNEQKELFPISKSENDPSSLQQNDFFSKSGRPKLSLVDTKIDEKKKLILVNKFYFILFSYFIERKT